MASSGICLSNGGLTEKTKQIRYAFSAGKPVEKTPCTCQIERGKKKGTRKRSFRGSRRRRLASIGIMRSSRAGRRKEKRKKSSTTSGRGSVAIKCRESKKGMDLLDRCWARKRGVKGKGKRSFTRIRGNVRSKGEQGDKRGTRLAN